MSSKDDTKPPATAYPTDLASAIAASNPIGAGVLGMTSAITVAPAGGAISKPKRDANGRILPGQSGNRSGRPKGVAALAREFQMRVPHDELVSWVEDIWRNRIRLVDEVTGEERFGEDGEPLYARGNYTHEQRMQAYQVILDRGYGKPVAIVDMKAMIDATVDDKVSGPVEAFDPDRLPDHLQESFATLFAHMLGESVDDVAPASCLRTIEAHAVEVGPSVRESDNGQASAITESGPDPITERVPESSPADANPTTPDAIVGTEVACGADAPNPLDTTRAIEVEITGEPEGVSAPAAVTSRRMHTFGGKSSNVVSFEHDEDTGALDVTFKGGVRYRYANVTRAMADEFVTFPSAGQWVHARLKSRPDVHPCRALKGDE